MLWLWAVETLDRIAVLFWEIGLQFLKFGSFTLYVLMVIFFAIAVLSFAKFCDFNPNHSLYYKTSLLTHS